MDDVPEVVHEFKTELYSLYETRLPVSRAKMTNITKRAMKASKFYKHVVMIVEKFITKAAVQYKLPALYVMDSILRQSKHQSADREVFAPRFSKNIEKTFTHLFECPEQDMSKIIKVLNLWLKNNIYSQEVIESLFNLAPVTAQQLEVVEREGGGSPEEQPSSTQPVTDEVKGGVTIVPHNQGQIDVLLQQQQQQLQSLLEAGAGQPMITLLLDKAKQLQELQAIQQRLINENKTNPSQLPLPTPPPSSHLTSRSSIVPNELNKALLDDFDYSSEEEGEGGGGGGHHTILTSHPPPPVLSSDHIEPPLPPPPPPPPGGIDSLSATAFIEKLNEQFNRERDQDIDIPHQLESNILPLPPPPNFSHPPPSLPPSHPPFPPPPFPPLSVPSSNRPPLPFPPHMSDWPRPPPHFPPQHSPNRWQEQRGWSNQPPPPPPGAGRSSRFHSSPPTRFRERSPPYHHDREPFRERYRERSPYRSDRGRDRDRERDRNRDRDRDREKGRDGERRERGERYSPDRERKRSTPIHKSGHITVCSNTVWVGHLSKNISKEQLQESIQEFGPVKSIDHVIARGCAYVVMENRTNAVQVVDKLNLRGQKCKIAWAPGRGVKGKAYKEYWDVQNGISHIPHELVKSVQDLDIISDGGWCDPSTFPPELAHKDEMNLSTSPT